MSVDLPDPFPPSSAWISPGAIARLTPSSALVPGYPFDTSVACTAGCRVPGGADGTYFTPQIFL